MKKGSLILLFLILILGLLGSYKAYYNKKKPNNYYYTNQLAKNLTLNKNYEIKVLDNNFYKVEEISKENIETMLSFIKELKKQNFIDKPQVINAKPKYKFFIKFLDTNDKFVVNVYDTKYISIHPWDGEFTMDYITMESIPIRYNLYSLGKNTFVKYPDLNQ